MRTDGPAEDRIVGAALEPVRAGLLPSVQPAGSASPSRSRRRRSRRRARSGRRPGSLVPEAGDQVFQHLRFDDARDHRFQLPPRRGRGASVRRRSSLRVFRTDRGAAPIAVERCETSILRMTETIERRRFHARASSRASASGPSSTGSQSATAWPASSSNDGSGVVIEAEGDPRRSKEFAAELVARAPSLARIDSVVGRRRASRSARRSSAIARARPPRGGARSIPPDVATCDDCLRELFDPADRRYRYPFVNCTQCGPRFTIVRGVPTTGR